MTQESRRSITVTSEGEQHTFTGDVKLCKLGLTGTYYILMGDEVVWRQSVRNGVAAAVEIKTEGFSVED
ncbi:Uncharacterised protein [Nocardia farcinica]|uniref:Uncharacterized protein n=1 Tax=Nocardia farcinica TaxID=37329 RepID=A0A449G5N5_NOCFR|nr:hypothetical protein [Nocardia farcinica]VFA96174.1 Uncharacterised protein [Nocardia farcinica]